MSAGRGPVELAGDLAALVHAHLAGATDAGARAVATSELLAALDGARRTVLAQMVPEVTSAPPAASRGPAPSIRDVAAAAGVSYQTVSRVINDSPQVRPHTRDAVRQAIETLGFRPSRTARALGAGRSSTVTVVASDTMLYGYAATIRGIEQAARDRGASVGIRVVDTAAEIPAAVDYLADPSCGAVVVIAFDAVGLALFSALPVDVPAAAALDPGSAVPAGRTGIALDERSAANAATRHLLDLGHRTVHHISVPSERADAGRQAGWRDALLERGAAVPAQLAAAWDAAGGHRAAAELIIDPTVTAILCGNDDIAFGAQRALFEAGRGVPHDVSLIGFDDTPGAAMGTPALTTVHMDFAALGRACVTALYDGGSGGVLPVPRLVVRESTAAPASFLS